jgi:hypothetical protein
LFHPAGTRRVWVFRVLPPADREPFPALPAPSLLPALHDLPPDLTGTCHMPCRTGFTRHPTTVRSGSLPRNQDQFSSWALASLEALLPTVSAYFPSGFTRSKIRHLS